MQAISHHQVQYGMDWSIAEGLPDGVKTMLEFLVEGEWSVKHLHRLSQSLSNVLISFWRPVDGVQQYDNLSVVFNEFSTVTGELQEASDIITVFRLGPIHDHKGLMFLGVDDVLRNVRSPEIDCMIGPV